MKNWYRLRVPRSRRPGARWIMSKLAGIDRIPSLEKRLSQCGDDAMRACRCFQVNGFQANKIKRPRPHATESRRFLPESDVGLAQPSHRSAQACGPWGVMPVAAGHGARARSVMGRWSYRALASPMIPAYRGSRRTCGVAMPVAPQTGGSPVACSISHALAFFVERVLGRTWRGVRLTEGVGSSIGADGVSTEEVSLFGLFSSER